WTQDGEPQGLESRYRLVRALVCSDEIAPVTFKPSELRQHVCFTPSIMYGAVDFQCFFKALRRSLLVSSLPVERSEILQGAGQLPQVAGGSKESYCSLVMVMGLFRFAELFIGLGDVIERGGLTIGVAHGAAERKGFVVDLESLAMVSQLLVN